MQDRRGITFDIQTQSLPTLNTDMVYSSYLARRNNHGPRNPLPRRSRRMLHLRLHGNDAPRRFSGRAGLLRRLWKPTCRAHRDDTQAQRCHRCAGKLMTLFEGDELALDIARARARQPAELRERFCQICGPFMLDSCPIFRRTGAHDLRPKEQP